MKKSRSESAERMLRIGIPSKGRLSEVVSDLLHDAGLSFRRISRSLFARCRDVPVEIVFLRTDDIPILTAEGAIDLGITGADLVAEGRVDLIERLSLGVGGCRLALCVPDDAEITSPENLQGRRVATSFPKITQDWLAQHGVEVHLVELSGSVEIMVSLGVADAVVDLVETGSCYETVLVQNKSIVDADMADRIVRRLQGVVIARTWTLLEYNVPRDRLAEAEDITPGFNSPTVSALEENSWCSVRAMVRRNETHKIMERLESIGASAIIETDISNCRL